MNAQAIKTLVRERAYLGDADKIRRIVTWETGVTPEPGYIQRVLAERERGIIAGGKRHLYGLEKPKYKRDPVTRIIRRAAEMYGLPEGHLFGDNFKKGPKPSEARYAVFLVFSRTLGMGQAAICRAIHFDHQSVQTALKRGAEILASDPGFAEIVAELAEAAA